MCYFPLSYLAALKLDEIAAGEIKIKRWIKGVLLGIGVIWSVLLIALPLAGIYKDKLIPYIDDPFAVANLNAPVQWSMLESLWGVLYLLGIIAAIILMRKSFTRGMLTLAIVQIIVIQVTVLHFTPKIEAYTQRAAIRYFKSFQDQDVYVQVIGYKSFAHLFYSRKQPSENKNYHNERWLLSGPVDKPTYFICKITEAEKIRKLPQLQELGQRNGFVFFKRR